MNQPGRRIGWRDQLVGLLLAASYVALLFATAADIGMSRDESFYVTAAESYGRWFQQLYDDSDAALQRDAIDRRWEYNHEHPAFVKTLFALSWLAHQKWELYPEDSLAYRFPGMLCSGLLLWLLYIFGARTFGRPVGAFAAAAFALMPRVFYHAHLDCFDVAIVLMNTWVVYCYWRSLKKRRWAIWVGVAFGFALATKHNSWVLPGIFLIHFCWMAASERRARKEPGRGKKLRLVPLWLLAMVTIGPAIFIGTWPYLWHDTLQRIGWYAGFHLNHDYYNMAYFGRNYFEPPFPVAFPFVLTAFTVPATTLALASVGVTRRLRALVPPRLAERLWRKGRLTPDPFFTDVLLVGCLVAPLLIIALPSSPIFGGTKHWFPAYPFIALYAGLGFWHLTHLARVWVGTRLPNARYLVRAGVAVAVLAPSAVETVHSHPFGLSHYTFLAGGVPGAADHGMNRQFWGFTTGSLTEWFSEQMPDGGTVWLCDTTWGAFHMLKRDGKLPSNIRAARSLPTADYVMIHHEHHFAEVDHQAWVAFGSVAPAHVLTYDGVPIVTVYENPEHRREREAPQAEAVTDETEAEVELEEAASAR